MIFLATGQTHIHMIFFGAKDGWHSNNMGQRTLSRAAADFRHVYKLANTHTRTHPEVNYFKKGR